MKKKKKKLKTLDGNLKDDAVLELITMKNISSVKRKK